jgi:hypothetical protein
MKKLLSSGIIISILLIIVLSGCGGDNGGNPQTPPSTPAPVSTVMPTSSPVGTATPVHTATSVRTATPTPVRTATPAHDAIINSFTVSSNKVLLGTSVQLMANFQYGTGIITPGNIPITSGVPISLTPTVPTTYVLKVSNSFETLISDGLTVNVYLEGKYTYNLYGSYPIEAYFSFSSTGSGNFFWKRTFPGFVDGWGGVFHYTIKGSTIDLYWTDGNRSGTYSTIDSFGINNVMFEGANYIKH